MHTTRSSLLLLASLSLAGCAAWGDRNQSTRETDRARENERRVCLMQPPAQIEACLRRVEQDYVAREGMRQVDKPDPNAEDQTVLENAPVK